MQGDPTTTAVDDDAIVAATRRWIERAVIGLELCPFARAPFVQDRVRIRVSHARDATALAADLQVEAELLASGDPAQIETTLLVHPRVFADFLDYNDFLDVADALLVDLELDGILQVASFHPGYQFADAEPEAVENCSNRSPFPTLHLLRESSIDRAVEVMPDTDAIYLRNIQTLRTLGHAGWRALWDEPSPPIPEPRESD
jgi:hypothetical protein